MPHLLDELITVRTAATDSSFPVQFSQATAATMIAIRAVENDLEIVRHTTNDLLTPNLPDGGV